MERLEDRSLLSVNLPSMLAPSTAFYAPLFPGQSTTDVATQIQVVMPQNVPDGAPVNVGLVALDATNHPVSSFTDTADITSSDGSATLSASSVTFKNGFASLQVTFGTSASQTVTATDVDSTLVGTGTTNVGAPDVATHLAVVLPPTVGEGQIAVVKVAALDAQNHIVLSYKGTDTVTTSDGAATLSATTLTFSGGTASFQETFGTLGSESVTVTDNSIATLAGTASTTVVTPAAATHFAIQLPANSPDGEPVNVAAVALDANNHPVQGFSGTATITTSDAAGTLSATSVTFKNGNATFQATFATSGTQTVTATDTADSLAGTGTTNVATPDVATHFGLMMPPNVPTGATVNVGIVPLDANNNPVPTYVGTVNLTTSDSKGTLSVTSITFPFSPSASTPANGNATPPMFTATFATAGTQSITATDSVNSSLTGSVSTNVVAPDVATHFGLMLPSSVPTGSPVTVGIVALDAKNNPVPNYMGTVNLSTSDTGAKLSATSVTFKPNSPPVTFTVTFATTGSQTIMATDSSNASLTGTINATVTAAKVVTPDVATHFGLQLPPNAPNGSPVTVGIVALDANNNPVPTYTGTVNLTTTDSKAVLSATSITLQANTPNTFTVTFATAGSESVMATDSQTSSITGTANTTVAAANVATHFGFMLPPNVPTGSPPITVGLVALNAQNQPVPNYTGSVVIATSDTKAVVPTSPVKFVQGVAQIQVTFGTAGPQTLTVTDTSNSSLTSTENLTVILPKTGPGPGTGN